MARKPVEEKYFQAAKRQEKDGVLEFDDDARVSVSSEGGAYVQGWMWVSDEDAEVERG